jgi:hypothetical protein
MSIRGNGIKAAILLAGLRVNVFSFYFGPNHIYIILPSKVAFDIIGRAPRFSAPNSVNNWLLLLTTFRCHLGQMTLFYLRFRQTYFIFKPPDHQEHEGYMANLDSDNFENDLYYRLPWMASDSEILIQLYWS